MHMEGEEAIAALQEMFKEYHLDEYLPAFEALKADWERVCKDNFEFRRSRNGSAA